MPVGGRVAHSAGNCGRRNSKDRNPTLHGEMAISHKEISDNRKKGEITFDTCGVSPFSSGSAGRVCCRRSSHTLSRSLRRRIPPLALPSEVVTSSSTVPGALNAL